MIGDSESATSDLADSASDAKGAEPEDGPKCGGESFAAGTLVLLASGKTAPISSLKPGDTVVANDTKTGKNQTETVTTAWIHPDSDLYGIGIKAAMAHTPSTRLAATCPGTLHWTTAGFRQSTSSRACISRRRTASRRS